MLTRTSFNFAARRSRQRGTILILTMTLCFALAAVVLLLARKMSVEATAAANQVSVLQADEIERGAEQYVLNLFTTVVTNGLQPVGVMDNLTYTDDYFAGIPVGADINNPTGWFWILRPQYDEDDLPLFGLVDECSKLDLNWFGAPATTAINPATAATTVVPPFQTYIDGMLMLPNITEEMADSMFDWRDDNDEATNLGSESSYYQSLELPYPAKNKRYEHVEELLMVAGFTPAYLFGDGTADPLGDYSSSNVSGANSADDPQLRRGMYDVLTTHGHAAPAAAGGGGGNTGTVGLINVNTAPRIVLQALLNSAGLDYNAADAVISYRQQNAINPGDGSTTWFTDALSSSGITGGQQLATRITGASLYYSADILAVSRNGRGFKRVRIIVDTTGVAASTGATAAVPATIVSRRDVTDKGWPLSPQVLESIRQSGTLTSTGVGGFGNTMGGTLR